MDIVRELTAAATAAPVSWAEALRTSPWTGWLLLPIPYSDWTWGAALGLLLALAAVLAVALTVGLPRARRWWNSDEPPRPNEDERGVSTVEMSLMEHLMELRTRLMIAGIAVAITTAIAFIFYRTWMDIAIWPLRGHKLQAIAPAETVFAYFQVTLVVGLILAMPIIVYELWAYVAPGLTRKERRYVVAIVPGGTLCFILGVCFAYFVLLPAAFEFLLHFGSGQIEQNPAISRYISFITHLLVAAGAIFELPLVMFVLAKVHLVNAKVLSGIRRYVIVAAFVVAAIITPTPDPFNQTLIAIPILVLYELGVLLARLA